jgi:hypothetical protein
MIDQDIYYCKRGMGLNNTQLRPLSHKNNYPDGLSVRGQAVGCARRVHALHAWS